jgi:ABC-type branched-subunit amino acid transport system substrate-binding protein
MSKMRKTLIGSVGAVALLAFAGAAAAEDVKFGFLVGFSGDMAPWAGALNNGAILAVEEINAAGGINGNTLVLVPEDNVSTAAGGVRGAQKLINVDKVSAIIGPESDPIMAILTLAKDSKVPVISTSAGTEGLDNAGGTGNYIYRTNASDSFLGVVHAKLLLDEIGQKEIVVVTENLEGTQSAANTFIRNYEKMGGTIARKVVLAPGQSSYLNEIGEVAGANPEGLIFLATGQAAGVNFVKQAYQRGHDWKYWVTSDLQNQDFVDAAGAEIVQGTTNPVSSQLEGADSWARFSEAYEARFGEAPQSGFYQAETYDAVILAALAAAAAEATTGEAIDGQLISVSRDGERVISFADGVKALAEGKDINYEGASGPVDFTPTGNVTIPATRILVVDENGQWVSTKTIDTSEYPAN